MRSPCSRSQGRSWRPERSLSGGGSTVDGGGDGEEEGHDEDGGWPVEFAFGVLFVLCFLAALGGAAAGAGAAAAEEGPKDEDQQEDDGEHAYEDAEGLGAVGESGEGSGGVAVDCVEDEDVAG